MNATGKCLCGAVTFSAEGVDPHFHACQCSMCRRWAGGPLMAVKVEAVAFEGASHIQRYASSKWAERGFCSKCGTHLFYRFAGSDDYIVFAGFFGEGVAFELKEQIFIDSKPEFYEFSNATENLTGAEVFAKFAPSD